MRDDAKKSQSSARAELSKWRRKAIEEVERDVISQCHSSTTVYYTCNLHQLSSLMIIL